MDKQAALKKLEDLEREVAALREIVEAPEELSSLLTRPRAGSGEYYWVLDQIGSSGLKIAALCANSTNEDYYSHGNVFQTRELAEAYAEAISTMLMLRHQPGTERTRHDHDQWSVWPDTEQVRSLSIIRLTTIGLKVNQISPCFVDGNHARLAVATVGIARILRMFKTLHHIGD